MSIYKHPEGKRFLFIHIPRTGGRFIESNLESNEWRCEPIDYYGVPHYNHSFIDDCEITHFHRQLYEKYFGEEDVLSDHLIMVDVKKMSREELEKFADRMRIDRNSFLTQVQTLETELYFCNRNNRIEEIVDGKEKQT